MTEKTDDFLAKVRECELDRIKITPASHLHRLTKPTSKYLNLNPFEVLCLPLDATKEETRKNFRRLSVLVHPDKNPDNLEVSKQAFEAVKLAMSIIEDDFEMQKIKLIYEEAGAMLDKTLKMYREKYVNVDEDSDPKKYCELKRKCLAKLFADYELKRQEYEEEDQLTKVRTAEEAIDTAFLMEINIEFEKNWEENREVRVSNWRDFTKNKSKKSNKADNFFKAGKALKKK